MISKLYNLEASWDQCYGGYMDRVHGILWHRIDKVQTQEDEKAKLIRYVYFIII